MGTSTRYRDKPEGTLDPPATETDEAILTALARAEASLRIVLAAIQEIQREMGIHHSEPNIPSPPNPDWDGTL